MALAHQLGKSIQKNRCPHVGDNDFFNDFCLNTLLTSLIVAILVARRR